MPRFKKYVFVSCIFGYLNQIFNSISGFFFYFFPLRFVLFLTTCKSYYGELVSEMPAMPSIIIMHCVAYCGASKATSIAAQFKIRECIPEFPYWQKWIDRRGNTTSAVEK